MFSNSYSYDFGKPIVGEATLSIYPTFFGSLQPFVNDLITRKVVPIDGSAYFEFDIRDELKLKEDYEREYLLDALVEEASTSSVQNFSSVITVHLDPYRVEATRLPSNYIPGVPFEVSVRWVIFITCCLRSAHLHYRICPLSASTRH